MPCSGTGTITKYEVEHNVEGTPTHANCEDADPPVNVGDAIKDHMKAAYPDAEGGCDEDCGCLEITGQDPTPSKWSPWYVRDVQFTVPNTKCQILYKATYRYRTRLYVCNCARGPIPSGQ